jgi:hypothetical protein
MTPVNARLSCSPSAGWPVRSPRNDKLVGFVSLAACLVLLLILVSISARESAVLKDEQDPRGPRPSQTRSGRAVRAPIQPVAPASVLVPSKEHDVLAVVEVRLGSWKSPGDIAAGFSGFRPGSFWPDRSEVDFPPGIDVDAVIAGIHGEGALHGIDIVQLTTARRIDVLPDEPWSALVALEVERIHANHEWQEDLAEYNGRYGIPDPNEVGWPAYYRAVRLAGESGPDLRFGLLLEMSESAVRRWPDHPMADFASLYMLEALSNASSDSYSAPEVGITAVNILRESRDPLVLDHATAQLANVGELAELDGGALDLLLEIFDDPQSEVPRQRLAVMAVETALSLRDDHRSQLWMVRHSESTNAVCSSGPERWCDTARQERDIRSSFLAANGVVAPATWQAALGAMARRCGHDGHRLGVILVGKASWSPAGWSWKDWSMSSSFSDCLESTPHEGPEPRRGTKVMLKVLPAEED